MRCVTAGQETCLKLGPESPNPGVPQAFYNKTLDADRDRVSDLFARASGSGIEIERRSVSDEELSELTGAPHDSLVMALVDRRYLYRSSPNSVSGFIESCFTLLHDSWAYGGGYIGHYVLLTGFDKARDGYYLLDPAKESHELFVHSEHLHAARRAHGTDEDLIVIPWDQPAAVQGEQREPLAKCSNSAVAAAG